jgi:hypothetical protein
VELEETLGEEEPRGEGQEDSINLMSKAICIDTILI